ncbi:MAG: bifunctional 2-C-methyl-D-erythritol 4-phosphate cytidylyltransferase/2-C-methyl-D-erythritol 2,4-cyclodiphosphate synthase [Hyphomicrobiales bacterium]|nr:MAG: bifunctional 2-C-methyl-D-erythritol 4-phosphate cytidylyltransferase/2-C-methyl-D-erythritol 2,4-cyclodiphosphate synthase [Hyphomicrobiales bacterium]
MSSQGFHRIAVLIVGAGSGARAMREGEPLPKQFVEIAGKTVFQHTVDAFSKLPEMAHICCVVPPSVDFEALYPVLEEQSRVSCVHGAETRQLSVLAGLRALEGMAERWDCVLIHDAARPFVSEDCIRGVVAGAEKSGGAIAAIPVHDSLKNVAIDPDSGANMIAHLVDRNGIYGAQTPQGFEFAGVLAAHEKALSDGKTRFTDDAAIYAAYVGPVTIAESDRNNWKITRADDLALAEKMLLNQGDRMNLPDVRVGNGFDVHAFESGREIILCGIAIPYHKSLKGHSDADVGLHALTDAMLGAISAGDIGQHFPPSDPKWKGAKSDHFLAHAVSLVAENRGLITHLDVTLICEAPKVGPHRDAMRARIAQICGIDVARVSVKATTSEKLGFTGREEGIAAMATASIVMEGPIS